MLNYHHYIQLGTLIIGIICFRKYWPVQYKLILVLVSISFFVEFYGSYLSYYPHKQNNWLYNIYVPIQAVLTLFITYKLVQIAKIKKVIVCLIFIFIIAFIITYKYHENFFTLNHYALTINLICCCIGVGVYFIDTMLNTVQIPLLHQPGFWFMAGVLLFSILLICRFAFWNLTLNNKDYSKIRFYLIIASNTFLYLGCIATFICSNKRQYLQ